MARPQAIEWQRSFADGLQQIARENPGGIRVLERHAIGDDGSMSVLISLPTAGIPHAEGGLELGDEERFVVTIPPTPFVPPYVEVEHRRFVGFPHVLQGSRLCIYLDPNSEWDPASGATGYLDRLWAWLEDAAAGKFDASNALYHAVGGVTSWPAGRATIIVRQELAERHELVHIRGRLDARSDLVHDRTQGDIAAPVWHSPDSLPFGVSSDLSELAAMLDDPQMIRGGKPVAGVAPKLEGILTTLKAAADRNPPGANQPFILSVAHPRGGSSHLLAGALAPDVGDRLRSSKDAVELATSGQLPIEWHRVSDERPSVTTRRDSTRPMRRLAGRSVLLWGCGGLGSWIAEYLVRAGVSHLILCDPGIVTGGLLVRQAYEELDIGTDKASALASRLRKLDDAVRVSVEPGYQPDDLVGLLASLDLAIDATANLAVTRRLAAATNSRRATVAQVATDRQRGVLGIATIWPPTASKSIEAIDSEVGDIVRAQHELEPYHELWGHGTEGGLVPTRGCSIPTFHGAAADLAAVAGTLVSLIAGHLDAAPAGVHLVAMPHSGLSCPPHRFVEVDGTD